MKTKIKFINTKNEVMELPLDMKDIWDIQTKASKRTTHMGAAATAINLLSIVMPNGVAKKVLSGIGTVVTVATVASCVDSVKQAKTEDGVNEVNENLMNIIRKRVTCDLIPDEIKFVDESEFEQVAEATAQ